MNNIFTYLKHNQTPQLLIVADDAQAVQTQFAAQYFDIETFVLSDLRANYGDDLLAFSTEIQEITKTLEEYYEHKGKKLLISPLRTASFPLPKKECFDTFELKFGDTVDIEELKSKLYNWGYYFVDIVTAQGEVSIRGDIIDIAPLNTDNAYRISLFDDEIESIRQFDIENQKSYKEELESLKISAAFLALDEENFEVINERLQEDHSDTFVKDIHSLGFWYLDSLAQFYPTILQTVITKDALDEIEEAYIFEENRLPKEQFFTLDKIFSSEEYSLANPANIHEFLEFHKEKKITIISATEAKIKAHDFDLSDTNINYLIKPWIINLISKDEVILSLNKEVKRKKRRKVKLLVDELRNGDLVVHEEYGIGRFEEVNPITVMGAMRDFVTVVYAGEDKLFIPVENIGVIDRYVATGDIATLDKLGKGSFAKLKSKVKDKLFAIANDIIQLAASRELVDGIKFTIPQEKINQFQQDAGFEYTKDQNRSIKETLADLGSGKVMDRLLSGDVGFGKTEVAANAILASFLNGYQSLFVCPTTLLASQHYSGLKKRFESFGLKVAKLDGKSTAKEKSAVKKALSEGEIDLVVGTHSLLSVTCQNLALVIIDEEHKFGVKQKEKLKNLRQDVHIFSMSATPIPRTLNLALSKIKGMSSLLTPPNERLGVRSFVKEHSEKLIKEVILREKRRGGQLFYIYNNIATIEAKKEDLLEILPNIKIEIIHSQIKQAEAEKILEDFHEGKFDILLATSIVESGLHLPNANSIIIDGADRFGIADLHQLRGRVGRSNKEGYCYFVVEDKNKITNDALKRLVALESNSYLGSGTALAHQDLEIRGGGNIIGEAQSGHIKQIGYALYLKMLEEALAILSGEIKEEKLSVDIKLTINAYISEEYINEDRVRLELYRRLSKAQSKQEVYEIEEEMEDRFGKADLPTKQFLELIIIKILALEKNIKLISNYEMNITLTYNDDKKETIKSYSKDDDDLIKATLQYLNKL